MFSKDEVINHFSVLDGNPSFFQKSIHLDRVDFLLGAMLVQDSLLYQPPTFTNPKTGLLQVGGDSSQYVCVRIYLIVITARQYFYVYTVYTYKHVHSKLGFFL